MTLYGLCSRLEFVICCFFALKRPSKKENLLVNQLRIKGIYKGTELVLIGGLIIGIAIKLDTQWLRLFGLFVVVFGSYRLTKLQKY